MKPIEDWTSEEKQSFSDYLDQVHAGQQKFRDWLDDLYQEKRGRTNV